MRHFRKNLKTISCIFISERVRCWCCFEARNYKSLVVTGVEKQHRLLKTLWSYYGPLILTFGYFLYFLASFTPRKFIRKNYLKWIKICKFKPGLLESSRSHVAAVLWGRPHLSLVDLGGRYLAHRSLYMTMGPLARCTIEHGKPVVKNLRGWEIGFEVTA